MNTGRRSFRNVNYRGLSLTLSVWMNKKATKLKQHCYFDNDKILVSFEMMRLLNLKHLKLK